jgi:hypothetical protein
MIGIFVKYCIVIWGSFADAQDDMALWGQLGGGKARAGGACSRLPSTPKKEEKCHSE